jgi:hypothetical protein
MNVAAKATYRKVFRPVELAESQVKEKRHWLRLGLQIGRACLEQNLCKFLKDCSSSDER